MVVALIAVLGLVLLFAPTISNVIGQRTAETAQQQQERKDKERADQITREDEGVFGTLGRIIFGNQFIDDTFGKSKNTIPELEESASNTLGRDIRFAEKTSSDKKSLETFNKSLNELTIEDSILINQALQKQEGRKATNFGVVN